MFVCLLLVVFLFFLLLAGWLAGPLTQPQSYQMRLSTMHCLYYDAPHYYCHLNVLGLQTGFAPFI